MALRTTITERSNDELLLAAMRKKFLPAFATYDGVPSGTHLTVLVITSTGFLTEAQMNGLETAVGNIAGVGICRVVSQGPANGIPVVPASHQVNLQIETSLEVSPVPTP